MSPQEHKRTHQVAFNTGAFYSLQGQRIAVWLRKTETGYVNLCCLVDFDRQLCCQFPVRLTSALNSAFDVGLHAMHMYRCGQYDLDFTPDVDQEVRGEMAAVLSNGYGAFISNPAVQVLATMASPLRTALY